MFKQFAVTLVIAVVLSGIVALTLTPALCAMLLKGRATRTHTTGSSAGSTDWFDRITGRYVGRVGGVLGRPRTWLAAFAVMLALAVVLWRRVPTGVHSDRGQGLLRDRDAAARRVVSRSAPRRWSSGWRDSCTRSRRSVNVVALAGLDVLTRTNQTNGATMFVLLKPWDERGRTTSRSTRSQADQREAVRDEGRRRLRLQPAGDSGPGHHGGRGGQPPGPHGQGRPRLRATACRPSRQR